MAPSESKAVYVGDSLHVDLWVKPALGAPKSLLIRSIDADGDLRSAFLHIDNSVRVLPTFSDSAELVRERKPNIASNSPREINWAAAKKKNFRAKRFLESALAVMTVSILVALLTGFLQFRVILSGSMVPFMKVGDVVVATKPTVLAPTKGRVVLYSARDLSGKVVDTWAHRVIGGDIKTGLMMKGDANAQPDLNHPTIADIEGVRLFTIPQGSRFLNPKSMLLIGSGFALISFAYSRRKYFFT